MKPNKTGHVRVKATLMRVGVTFVIVEKALHILSVCLCVCV